MCKWFQIIGQSTIQHKEVVAYYVDDAIDIYEQLRDSGLYATVCITDGDTGAVYLYCNKTL